MRREAREGSRHESECPMSSEMPFSSGVGVQSSRVPILLLKKRKQPSQLLPIGPATILAYLERLGVLYGTGLVLAVPLDQIVTITIRHRLGSPRVTLAHLAATVFLFLRIGRHQVRRTQRAAL